MSYSLYSVVDFGSGRTGLTTVGYRLYDHLTGFGPRVTAGVVEIIDGKFGALITYPDAFAGVEVWDSGEVAPIYAINVCNPATVAAVGALTEAQDAKLTAIKAKTDLIAAGQITVVSPVSLSGNAIFVRAGDSWSIPITGLGSLAGIDKLWFAVNKLGQPDSAAKLLIERTAGLLVANGISTGLNASDAGIAINDVAVGDITITVEEAVTTVLSKSGTWAVKILTTTGETRTLAIGSFSIAKAGVAAIA